MDLVAPDNNDYPVAFSSTENELMEMYDYVASDMRDTYIKKNTAYGNSFDHTIDKFGYIAALIRLNDKMERLCNLMQSDQFIIDLQSAAIKDPDTNESILDTTKDLANYAIMLASKLYRDINAIEAS